MQKNEISFSEPPLSAHALSGQLIHDKANLKAIDQLNPSFPGTVNKEGLLGNKLDSCIINGVMVKNFELYSNAYRDKMDEDGGFRGEFWGKWITYAALASYRS